MFNCSWLSQSSLLLSLGKLALNQSFAYKFVSQIFLTFRVLLSGFLQEQGKKIMVYACLAV
jgi:hypothetical protein